MQLPYSEELNIEYLGRLFDNTSECYKFFWFKAIVSNIKKNQLEISYEDLVDEMIWKYDKIQEIFNKCMKEYINSDSVKYKMYREGLGKTEFTNGLESIILPVYQSAKNCGFGNWVYEVS